MRLPLWTKKDMTGKRFSYKADYQVTGMQDHVPVNPYDTIAFPKKELFFCFPASYNINTVRTDRDISAKSGFYLFLLGNMFHYSYLETQYNL